MVRRDNINGAWAKSRHSRAVPVDGLLVQAHEQYVLERAGVSGASVSDFVFVNLFRPPVGAPMKPGAVNELFTALCRRAGLDQAAVPHALRHAFASNVWMRARWMRSSSYWAMVRSAPRRSMFILPRGSSCPAAAPPGRSPGALASGGHGRRGGLVTALALATAGLLDEDSAARLEALLDDGFLADIGWDAQTMMLSVPAGHPELGWPLCQVPGCDGIAETRKGPAGLCAACAHYMARTGTSEVPTACAKTYTIGVGRCMAGSPRPWESRRRPLCAAHDHQQRVVLKLTVEEFLARPGVVPPRRSVWAGRQGRPERLRERVSRAVDHRELPCRPGRRAVPRLPRSALITRSGPRAAGPRQARWPPIPRTRRGMGGSPARSLLLSSGEYHRTGDISPVRGFKPPLGHEYWCDFPKTTST